MEVDDLGRSEDDEASCIDNQISTIKISSYSMEINYSYFKRMHSMLYNSAYCNIIYKNQSLKFYSVPFKIDAL